jgi:hypothetical protein
MALMSGLVLLGLTLFSDPKALLNQLGSFQAASGPPVSENVMLTDERDVLRQELKALKQELEVLRQQVADLTKQNIQPGPREKPPRVLVAGDVAVANAAVAKPLINPPPMTMRLTDSLPERLERVETCLFEAKLQEATLLLESILFQLIFRPVPGETVQETAAMIKQALEAVAKADLEEAAVYVILAQPKFRSSL